MPRLRLAHFSDVHFTESPLASPSELRGKRITNALAHLLGDQRVRFRDVATRIAALLEDVDAAGVDHALCTGDLTMASTEGELAGIAALFGPRRARPDRYTVLPGNHDRYVQRVVDEGTFERHLGALCAGAAGTFPFEKRLGAEGAARLVVFDTSRPTGLLDSSGACGRAQRARLRAMLDADTTSLTFVATHYGLLRYGGVPDRPRHGMRDYREVMALLDATPARIALVLHGHMHNAYTVQAGTRTVVCAGSATDLLVHAGYFIYDVDLDTFAVTLERREWNRARARYERVPCDEFQAAMSARTSVRFVDQRPLL